LGEADLEILRDTFHDLDFVYAETVDEFLVYFHVAGIVHVEAKKTRAGTTGIFPSLTLRIYS
jgi:hypothetical protein